MYMLASELAGPVKCGILYYLVKCECMFFVVYCIFRKCMDMEISTIVYDKTNELLSNVAEHTYMVMQPHLYYHFKVRQTRNKQLREYHPLCIRNI